MSRSLRFSLVLIAFAALAVAVLADNAAPAAPAAKAAIPLKRVDSAKVAAALKAAAIAANAAASEKVGAAAKAARAQNPADAKAVDVEVAAAAKAANAAAAERLAAIEKAAAAHQNVAPNDSIKQRVSTLDDLKAKIEKKKVTSDESKAEAQRELRNQRAKVEAGLAEKNILNQSNIKRIMDDFKAGKINADSPQFKHAAAMSEEATRRIAEMKDAAKARTDAAAAGPAAQEAKVAHNRLNAKEGLSHLKKMVQAKGVIPHKQA